MGQKTLIDPSPKIFFFFFFYLDSFCLIWVFIDEILIGLSLCFRSEDFDGPGSSLLLIRIRRSVVFTVHERACGRVIIYTWGGSALLSFCCLPACGQQSHLS